MEPGTGRTGSARVQISYSKTERRVRNGSQV